MGDQAPKKSTENDAGRRFVEVDSSFLICTTPSDCRLALTLLRHFRCPSNPARSIPLAIVRCSTCHRNRNLRFYFDYTAPDDVAWCTKCFHCRMKPGGFLEESILKVLSNDLSDRDTPPYLATFPWRTFKTISSGGFHLQRHSADELTLPLLRKSSVCVMAINLMRPDVFRKIINGLRQSLSMHNPTVEPFTGFHILTYVRFNFGGCRTGLLHLMGPANESSNLLASLDGAQVWASWELKGDDFGQIVRTCREQAACQYITLQQTSSHACAYIANKAALFSRKTETEAKGSLERRPEWRSIDWIDAAMASKVEAEEFWATRVLTEKDEAEVEGRLARAIWMTYQAHTVICSQEMNVMDAVSVRDPVTDVEVIFRKDLTFTATSVLWYVLLAPRKQ